MAVSVSESVRHRDTETQEASVKCCSLREYWYYWWSEVLCVHWRGFLHWCSLSRAAASLSSTQGEQHIVFICVSVSFYPRACWGLLKRDMLVTCSCAVTFRFLFSVVSSSFGSWLLTSLVGASITASWGGGLVRLISSHESYRKLKMFLLESAASCLFLLLSWKSCSALRRTTL